MNIDAWALVLLASVNNCIGSLLLKKSRLEVTDSGFAALLFSPWFIGGLLFYGVNVIIFAKALDKLPISAAYPVLSSVGFALIAMGGSYFFGEKLGLNQFVGLGIIVTGIIIMSRT